MFQKDRFWKWCFHKFQGPWHCMWQNQMQKNREYRKTTKFFAIYNCEKLEHFCQLYSRQTHELEIQEMKHRLVWIKYLPRSLAVKKNLHDKLFQSVVIRLIKFILLQTTAVNVEMFVIWRHLILFYFTRPTQ